MNRTELQTSLKNLRAQGLTDVKLNSKTEVLAAEYERICKTFDTTESVTDSHLETLETLETLKTQVTSVTNGNYFYLKGIWTAYEYQSCPLPTISNPDGNPYSPGVPPITPLDAPVVQLETIEPIGVESATSSIILPFLAIIVALAALFYALGKTWGAILILCSPIVWLYYRLTYSPPLVQVNYSSAYLDWHSKRCDTLVTL